MMWMEMIRLGDACEILNGFAFKSQNYVDSGIRIIRISNVQKGFIEDNTPAFYSLDSSGLDKYMLNEGDLLMSLTGNVGRVAILEKEFLPAALNQRVACIRLKIDKLSKGYLFHILNSDFFEQQCIRSSKGVAQKNMSTEWLKEYEIPVYSKEKQEAITEILDKVRKIITCRNQEIKKMDDLIKARFVELISSHNYAEVPLKELIVQDKKSERITDMENERYITLSSYGKGAHERIIKQGKYPVPFLGYRVKKGQFIYSRIDARNGAYDILSEDLDGFVVSKDFPVYDIKTEIVTPLFFRQSVLDERFIKQVQMSSFGATNRMRIKEEVLESYTIKLPDLSIQNQFADFVHQVDKSKYV